MNFEQRLGWDRETEISYLAFHDEFRLAVLDYIESCLCSDDSVDRLPVVEVMVQAMREYPVDVVFCAFSEACQDVGGEDVRDFIIPVICESVAYMLEKVLEVVAADVETAESEISVSVRSLVLDIPEFEKKSA